MGDGRLGFMVSGVVRVCASYLGAGCPFRLFTQLVRGLALHIRSRSRAPNELWSLHAMFTTQIE